VSSRNSKSRITNNDVFSGLGVRNKVQDDGDPYDDARLIALERVEPNPNQPRKRSDPEKDSELAADIAERGVLQPIIVREHPTKDGMYQIVAGERRWRAARRADLAEVPVIIKAFDDKEAQMVSLVENLQRADLDPMDEAVFFQQLVNDYNLSNREIARLINRSHGYVDNRMRLLNAPAPVSKQSVAAVERPSQRTERADDQPRLWKYRPQPFQKVRDYLGETIESWDEVEFDAKGREHLEAEISSLKHQISQLENLLHVKSGRKK
jgi:ParB/RepB/Spo0J family partition protein